MKPDQKTTVKMGAINVDDTTFETVYTRAIAGYNAFHLPLGWLFFLEILDSQGYTMAQKWAFTKALAEQKILSIALDRGIYCVQVRGGNFDLSAFRNAVERL